MNSKSSYGICIMKVLKPELFRVSTLNCIQQTLVNDPDE